MLSLVGVLMSLRSFRHGILRESGDDSRANVVFIGEMRIHE